MRVRPGAVGVLFVFALLLPSAAMWAADVTVSCDELRSRSHRQIPVRLDAGEQLTVTLCSNASTGYRWGETARNNDTSVVRQVSHEFLGPQTSRPGAAGRQRWILSGLRPGTAGVRFEYARSWESTRPTWTVALRVEVADPIQEVDPVWNYIPDRAQYGGADWNNEIRRVQGVSLDEAKRIAERDSRVTFFFYTKRYMNLAAKGTFRPGDAVFFTGDPWYGSAPGQADSYEKVVRPDPPVIANDTPTHHSGSSNCADFDHSAPSSVSYDLKVGDTLGYGLCAAKWMECDWIDQARISNPRVVRQIGHRNKKPNKLALRFAPRERFGFEATGEGRTDVTLQCRSETGKDRRFVMHFNVSERPYIPDPPPPPPPVARRPIVDWLPREDHPPIPGGLKVTCMPGPDELGSSPECPVIRWNGYTYWAYSHYDNRYGMTLVAYDPAGREVRRWALTGARYIWNIGLDPAARTVTLWGQANRTIVVSLDEILVPYRVGRAGDNR